jgi:DNA-directed RNA polymerase subunit RPC12/RpoP
VEQSDVRPRSGWRARWVKAADLEPAGLEMAVTCQRCGHKAVLDDTDVRLRNQRLAGRRYRCARCGAIGLPFLARVGLPSTANKLKVDVSGGELAGRQVEPRR